MTSIGLKSALLGLAIFSTCFIACAGTLDDPAAFSDVEGGANRSCGDVPSTVFAPSCAIAGCHAPPAIQSGLDLLSAGIGARILERQAAGGPGLLLLDSQNPDRSVLLLKIQANPPFGAVMPLGGTRLTDAQVQCVKAWLQAQIGSSVPSADSGTASSLDGGD